MSKAKFEAAKELIREEKYAEARAILTTINHTKASEWLTRLDALERRQAATNPTRKRSRRVSCIVVFVVLLVLVGAADVWFTQFNARMTDFWATQYVTLTAAMEELNFCSARSASAEELDECLARLRTPGAASTETAK